MSSPATAADPAAGHPFRRPAPARSHGPSWHLLNTLTEHHRSAHAQNTPFGSGIAGCPGKRAAAPSTPSLNWGGSVRRGDVTEQSCCVMRNVERASRRRPAGWRHSGSVHGTACLRRSDACRSGATPPAGKVAALVDPLVAPSRWAGIAADRRPYASATRSAGLHRPVSGGIVIADGALPDSAAALAATGNASVSRTQR